MKNTLSVKFRIDGGDENETFGVRTNFVTNKLEIIKGERSNAKIVVEEVSNSYHGENKTRCYNKTFSTEGDDFNLLLSLSKYDRIYVIDTNTNAEKKVDGEILSVSCFVGFKLKAVGNKIEASLLSSKPQCFEFRNHKQAPERISWRLLIDKIKIDGLGYGEKIAIVTDSELGDLENFNTRKKPILENFFLPDQFSLHYAKDKSSKGFCSHMIHFCDKEARILKEHIESSRHVYRDQPYPLHEDLFDRFKFWTDGKTLEIWGSEGIPTSFTGEVSLYGLKEV